MNMKDPTPLCALVAEELGVHLSEPIQPQEMTRLDLAIDNLNRQQNTTLAVRVGAFMRATVTRARNPADVANAVSNGATLLDFCYPYWGIVFDIHTYNPYNFDTSPVVQVTEFLRTNNPGSLGAPVGTVDRFQVAMNRFAKRLVYMGLILPSHAPSLPAWCGMDIPITVSDTCVPVLDLAWAAETLKRQASYLGNVIMAGDREAKGKLREYINAAISWRPDPDDDELPDLSHYLSRLE